MQDSIKLELSRNMSKFSHCVGRQKEGTITISRDRRSIIDLNGKNRENMRMESPGNGDQVPFCDELDTFRESPNVSEVHWHKSEGEILI